MSSICPPPAHEAHQGDPFAQGERTLSKLAEVEASGCECADQEALRNLLWLARCQQFFAHFAQHRQGFDLLPAARVSHDVTNAAHQQIEIKRIQAWARATGVDVISSVLNRFSKQEIALSLIHVASVQKG